MKNPKALAIIIILVASVVLVAPLVLLILNAMCVGYYDSVLGKLIDEL